jgi:hypothetical protein
VFTASLKVAFRASGQFFGASLAGTSLESVRDHFVV